MPRRSRIDIAPDLVELLELIRRGDLFAINGRIQNGLRLRDPECSEIEGSALVAATRTGFYSLISTLLEQPGWSQAEMDQAVYEAMAGKRLDLVDLLLAKGAKVGAIDFTDVCRTMDVALMERFLRTGVDAGAGNAFARALDETGARPLLGFYRRFQGEFPVLHAQASLALAVAVREKKVRWVALLRWAGADPFLAVPENLYDDVWDFTDRPGFSAADRACMSRDPEVVRALKLRPTVPQSQELLRFAAISIHPEVMREVVRIIPRASINGGERGGCDAVERLLDDFPFHYDAVEDRERRAAECLQILLDAGARWTPETKHLAFVRRRLASHSSRQVVRLVRLLLYTAGACDRAAVLELCRTPVMRKKIADADKSLARELDAFVSGEGA